MLVTVGTPLLGPSHHSIGHHSELVGYGYVGILLFSGLSHHSIGYHSECWNLERCRTHSKKLAQRRRGHLGLRTNNQSHTWPITWLWPDLGRIWPGLAGYDQRGTPSSRSSRSGDHQCRRRDSPEYDWRDGKVVSRKYSDEPSPRHGRYESSRRTPGVFGFEDWDKLLNSLFSGICRYLDSEALESSLVSLQLNSFLKALSVFSRFELDDVCNTAEFKASAMYVIPLSAKHQRCECKALAIDKGLAECKASASNHRYSCQIHRQGSERLLEDILVSWDGKYLIEDFSNWKDRFLVYLDGLEPYLLEILQNGPFVPMDTKIVALRLKFNAFKALEGEKVNGTFTRLKCLLNDLENNGVSIPQAKVNATFVNSLPRKWLSMNQTQRANNSIKNYTLAALYGKYNYEEGLIDQIYELETNRFTIQAPKTKALISNLQMQDSDSDVEEGQRSNSEFLADLNAEVKYKGLKAEIAVLGKKIDAMTKGKSEKGLVADSFDWDEESVSSDDDVIKVKALMAITEDELSVGRADARSGQWVEITMKKVQNLLSMTDSDERKHVLDYTHVDLHYVEDQRKNLLGKFNSLNQELSLCNRVTLDQLLSEQIPGNIVRTLRGQGKRKEKISPREIVFSKSKASKTVLEITSDSETEQRPLPPLPKLTRAEPANSLKSPFLTNLTLTKTVPKKKHLTSEKVSTVRGNIRSKPPSISESYLDKNSDLTTKKLLLTLMEEVKGLKEHIKLPIDTSPSES
ncbi:hypothetical protein Tco_0573955 [Tanacetum coccineum]